MAFDPEEQKKIRQTRQQQRARQAARRRKLLLRLVIAAVVLVLVGVLILQLARTGSENNDPPETQQTQNTPTTQSTQSAAPSEPTTTIHFAAAGDLNITDNVIAAGGSDYDYTETFLDVAHLLADADLTALNLEGSLVGAPYGTGSASAPVQLMQALDRAGVDLVQLSNSYSINHGIAGLATTAQNVRAAGMEPLGVRTEDGEKKGYVIYNINGIKVAVVAFTKGMDGMSLPSGSEDCVNLLYTDYNSTYQSVDTAGITAVLDAINAESPDITIAMLHWGSEYNDTISASQTKIISLLQSRGVDAIIGNHPHYVQEMVFDAEAGTFVAYSLGDFLGDAQRSGTQYSVILDLEITKDNATGVTKITGYDYTPIYTVAEEGSPLRILRLEEAIAAYEADFIETVSKSTYESMTYALSRVKARVGG